MATTPATATATDLRGRSLLMRFVPAHSQVAAASASPAAWLLLLHGIFGSGVNWRSFARKLVERRPEWGAILVDLRMHGDSQAAPPPHTLAAAAADLVALGEELRQNGQPVRAVIGHSFGGKVALRHRADAGPELLQTWMLDASPSARPGALDEPDNSVARVLDMLAEFPASFPDRGAFVARVTNRGYPPMLGQWLAMNLDRADYRLRLDLTAVRALLTDYYAHDLWAAAENPAPGELHVVIAENASALSDSDRARLAQLETSLPHVHPHLFEGVGHWLHMEAPDRLLDLLSTELPQP